MAETIRRVDYFYLTVPSKPGEGVRILNTLKEADINLLAFSGFPSARRSQIDFVPEDPIAFRKVAQYLPVSKGLNRVLMPRPGYSTLVPYRREYSMTETIRRVDYFYLTVPSKPGEGVRILNTLKEADINLLAFSGFPSGRRSQIDFVPEDPIAFRKVARKAGWKLSPRKSCFLIEGEDQAGAFLDVVSRLADAKINVTASAAVCTGEGRYGALLWVKSPDVGKVVRKLGIKKRDAASVSSK